MIGEAALNGLFQWLPQGLFEIGKWGLGQRWNGNSKCSNKRKKGEEEEEGTNKRSKHCPSFFLKHKLVLEHSGSSLICAPLSRAEAAEDSTLESHPVISFSIGVSSPLGKKTRSCGSMKDPSPVQHRAPLDTLKSGAKDVSAMCSYQSPQLPAATTATAFFDPIGSLFDESDDDEALSDVVATANSVDHPPLEALKGQLKQVLDKGPNLITSQDQSTMAQLCEAIERHPDYSTADHGAMWTLRHLAKSFADILELSNSSRGLAEAEANAKYAQAKAELRAKKARARESHAEIEQRQRVVEKLSSEAARLRIQLAATEVKLKQLENEVKVEKERDAALLHSIQATSSSCKKAGTERRRLQRENCDLNKKLAEVHAAVAFLHSWLSL